MSDLVTYAIGDVHGEAERLSRLHDSIFLDIGAHGAKSRVIHLGDLVDRGPESRACIILARAMERASDDVEGISLMGNHESMMLDAHSSSDPRKTALWSRNGGDTTIDSYFRALGETKDWRDAIDADHVAWLAGLKTIYRAGADVFVHAGLDPSTFPAPDPEANMWMRTRAFFEDFAWPDRPELRGLRVVHGHTPTQFFAPDVSARRINIDTGAVFGGPLTAVVLAGDERPRFLTA